MLHIRWQSAFNLAMYTHFLALFDLLNICSFVSDGHKLWPHSSKGE